MPVMLSTERLQSLQDSCTSCAYDNWDGHVVVSQDDHGILTFKMLNEEDEEECCYKATFLGSVLDHEIWLFSPYPQKMDDDTKPVPMTLVPAAIMGLMGL
ncbi:MAG: hypothetical protein ACRD6W_19695 [Nitrososphaerales archaeon]